LPDTPVHLIGCVAPTAVRVQGAVRPGVAYAIPLRQLEAPCLRVTRQSVSIGRGLQWPRCQLRAPADFVAAVCETSHRE
jgi:hypothetical protein